MKTNNSTKDIWISYHWWGWKWHFNNQGIDYIVNKVKKISQLNCYTWWLLYMDGFYYFIFLWIANKIINLKNNACPCKNKFLDHKQCPPFTISELTINFWWLPLPFLPITNKVTNALEA